MYFVIIKFPVVSSSVKNFNNISEFNPRYSHIKGDISLMTLSIYRIKSFVNQNYIFVRSNLSERPWPTTTLFSVLKIVLSLEQSQDTAIYILLFLIQPADILVQKKYFFLLSVALLGNFMPPPPHRADLCLFKRCKKCAKITSKGGVGEGGGCT